MTLLNAITWTALLTTWILLALTWRSIRQGQRHHQEILRLIQARQARDYPVHHDP